MASRFSSFALLFLLAAAGCSKQSEAERCELQQGGTVSHDCEDGLVCVRREGVSDPICCPPTGGSTPECRGQLVGQPDAATDTGSEVATDGATEAAAEAGDASDAADGGDAADAPIDADAGDGEAGG